MSSAPEALPVRTHEVSFYDRDVDAVALLTQFALAGLSSRESVVVFATDEHLLALDAELREKGFDPVAVRATRQLITMDATEALSSFVQSGSLDPYRFAAGVGAVLRSARSASTDGLRVYGEMVALLWDRGDVEGALEVESISDTLAAQEGFSLLCAYPITVLGEGRLEDLGRVCELHSELMPPADYGWSPSASSQEGDLVTSGVFLPVPGAVAAARRFVIDALERWGNDDLSWDAALVTSEIATNAINHTRAPFRATLTRSGGHLRIGVEDIGSGFPARGPGTPTGLGGRGMAIVEELCQCWGWEPMPRGKVVWAELGAERVVSPG